MKGELKAQTEKTETDRKRERRVKKYMKRKRQKERARREKLVQKLNPGLGNKYSKEKAIKELEKQSKAGKGVTMVQVGVTLLDHMTKVIVITSVVHKHSMHFNLFSHKSLDQMELKLDKILVRISLTFNIFVLFWKFNMASWVNYTF